VLGLIARFHGFSILKFIRYIKEELLIVLGTSSSESVLPRMMAKLENLGVKKSTVGLVIPHRLFVQSRRDVDLPHDGRDLHRAGDEYAAHVHAGADAARRAPAHVEGALPGVTGSGFIVLAATLSAVGHVPVAGLALILGIDRFMSEARALTNLIGNGVATGGRRQVVRRARSKPDDQSAEQRDAGRCGRAREGDRRDRRPHGG
jgi:aerobic C4-dicarboxylate transport protein